MDLGICKKCGYFEGRCKCGKGEVLLKENERLKVSKFLSGLLRHFGRRFGLMIDEDGWVRIDDVLRVLKSRYDIGRKHLELIVAFDKKGRFEIRGNRIRARYGHSINVKSDWSESDEIPSKLYHATHPKNLESIFRSGLLPMRRREVHMCATPEEAIEVGKRYSPEPILLEVDAKRVLSSGIKIRKKGKVYTADWIPPEFLRLADIFCHI